MASLRMALLCLVTAVLVFAVLNGQTNGDIDVASSFTGATDLIKDAAGEAAEQINDKSGGFFAGEVNNVQGGDAASNANVNSASATAGTNEGFEEEEGTLGGDWRVIGH